MSSNYKIEKIEKLPESEALILGEIALEFLNACRKDALKHLNEHINLPGFRKGAIPEDHLIKTVGEMAVLEETAEIAMSRAYPEIVMESKLRPIMRPEISITKMAPGIPLSFRINLVLEPEFTLPDYKKIASEVKAHSAQGSEGPQEEDPEKKHFTILENIVKATEINMPKKFVEFETHHLMHHFKDDLNKAGISLEKYLEQVGKTEEEVKKSFEDQIRERTKAELIVGKIAQENKLTTIREVFDLLSKKD